MGGSSSLQLPTLAQQLILPPPDPDQFCPVTCSASSNLCCTSRALHSPLPGMGWGGAAVSVGSPMSFQRLGVKGGRESSRRTNPYSQEERGSGELGCPEMLGSFCSPLSLPLPSCENDVRERWGELCLFLAATLINCSSGCRQVGKAANER